MATFSNVINTVKEKKKSQKHPISIYLDDKDYIKLDDLVQASNSSRSAVISALLAIVSEKKDD